MSQQEQAEQLLGRLWLFSDLNERELTELGQVATRKRCDAGSVIVQQGETDGDLYGVLSGHMKVSIVAADGREVVMNLLKPGDVFGEIALLDGQARSATVTAMDESELLVIHRAQFLPMLHKNPAIATKLLAALARLVRHLSERTENRAFLDVRERLAKQLLELGDTCGTVLGPNQVALGIRLSQQELGDMVEATRESVNKCLREWVREGIMRRGKRQLVIQDRERLAALVRR